MDERLRKMFREEMSAERQPPVGELVEAVVRDGRRARRRRRTWAGVGAAGVAKAVGAVLLVPGGGTGGGPAAAPLTGPKPVLAASSTSTAIKQPAGAKSPVTDAAVIEQLARLLPQGRTSGYARSAPEKGRYAFGQIYLDTGKGPGEVLRSAGPVPYGSVPGRHREPLHGRAGERVVHQ